MRRPVSPLGWTPEEHAEYSRTGKSPQRTVEVPNPPGPPEPSPPVPPTDDLLELATAIRDYHRLDGKIEGLREAPSKLGKKGGETPKKEKPWVPYARMLTLKIPVRARTLPDSRIAAILSNRWLKEKPAEWAREKPDCPSLDTLRKFVGKLRDDGEFPPLPARGGGPRVK